MGSHLVAAMQGADAVITTATGYTRGGRNADDIDTVDKRPRAKGDERDSELFELVLGDLLVPEVRDVWRLVAGQDAGQNEPSDTGGLRRLRKGAHGHSGLDWG
jgi:hypothetical protein